MDGLITDWIPGLCNQLFNTRINSGNEVTPLATSRMPSSWKLFMPSLRAACRTASSFGVVVKHLADRVADRQQLEDRGPAEVADAAADLARLLRLLGIRLRRAIERLDAALRECPIAGAPAAAARRPLCTTRTACAPAAGRAPPVTALANSAGGTPSANTRSSASAQSFARIVLIISRLSAISSHSKLTVSALTRSRTTTTFGSVRKSLGKHVGGRLALGRLVGRHRDVLDRRIAVALFLHGGELADEAVAGVQHHVRRAAQPACRARPRRGRSPARRAEQLQELLLQLGPHAQLVERLEADLLVLELQHDPLAAGRSLRGEACRRSGPTRTRRRTFPSCRLWRSLGFRPQSSLSDSRAGSPLSRSAASRGIHTPSTMVRTATPCCV